MTKWKIGLIVVGLVSAVGCGDSTSGTDNTTGGDNAGGANSSANGGNTTGGTNDAGSTTGGDSGSASTTGGGDNTTAGGDEGDGGNVGGGGGPCTDDASGKGACDNTCDQTQLASFDPGATASGCGMMCLADDTCNACYDKDANFSKVSPTCRGCWVAITRCVADKCVVGGGAPCLLDANGKACSDCRSTMCDGKFTACSGIDPSMM